MRSAGSEARRRRDVLELHGLLRTDGLHDAGACQAAEQGQPQPPLTVLRRGRADLGAPRCQPAAEPFQAGGGVQQEGEGAPSLLAGSASGGVTASNEARSAEVLRSGAVAPRC
jgi:hypothetical protein